MSRKFPFHVGDRQPNWDNANNQPDFQEVLQGLEPEPQPTTQPSATRHLLLILGGIAAAIAAFFTFSGDLEPEKVAPAVQTTAAQSSPVSGSRLSEAWQPAPDVFTIDPTRDTFLQTQNGVGVSIPAGSFDTEESVDIELRYFNDALKVMASDISMTYDSAGVTWHFMSDGMVELNAFKQGSPVQLAEGRTIQLELPAMQPDQDFCIYQRDSRQQTWKYEEANQAKTYRQAQADRIVQFLPAQEVTTTLDVSETERALDALRMEERKLERLEPIRPFERNPEADHFTIDALSAEFPALAAFEGMEFEVRSRGFALDVFERTWDDVIISRIPEKDQLEVQLLDGSHSISFKAVPVFSGEAFEKALSNYESARVEHQIKQNRCKDEIHAREAILAQIQRDAEKPKLTSGQRTAAIFSRLTQDINPEQSFRQFEIGSLGICNADIAVTWYSAPAIPVDLKLREGDRMVRPEQALLIDLERNAFYTLRGEDLQNIRFNRKRDHLLFATGEAGKALFFVDSNALRNLEKNPEFPQELIMKACSEPVSSLEEFLAQISELDV